jgi:4-diphosphocytidyl-2-C-methyl-D-erythritol kinase
MIIKGFAPAKINLTLHVTGQRADGYHLLDSIVVFADVGDHLRFRKADDMRIDVSGPFAQGVPTDNRNLVWKAAELVEWRGHIELVKNLPHGAGIGGGSSDAAAVLRAFGGADHAVTLGADVPVCLATGPQRMRGIGDVLDPLDALAPLEVVLVNPAVQVPTGPVFKALASKQNSPMPDIIPRFKDAAGLCSWLLEQRNDLQPPACAIAPAIHDALAALEGAMLARMSGSGATCFGLFAQGADLVAARIARAHPDWWVRAGKLLS